MIPQFTCKLVCQLVTYFIPLPLFEKILDLPAATVLCQWSSIISDKAADIMRTSKTIVISHVPEKLVGSISLNIHIRCLFSYMNDSMYSCPPPTIEDFPTPMIPFQWMINSMCVENWMLTLRVSPSHMDPELQVHASTSGFWHLQHFFWNVPTVYNLQTTLVWLSDLVAFNFLKLGDHRSNFPQVIHSGSWEAEDNCFLPTSVWGPFVLWCEWVLI